MKDLRIAIMTVEMDLHAYAVRKALRDRHGAVCHIVETDCFADSGRLTWSPTESFAPTLPAREGREIDVRSLDLIWWRRPNGTSWQPPHGPKMPPGVTDEVAVDIIAKDCKATFTGIMLNEFRGVWINNPEASRNAENKLWQLRAATQAGLRVPRTLISQDPASIREFCRSLNNNVIVKTVTGTYKVPLSPGKVDEALLASDESLRLSPAIYQEKISGNRHLRIQVFGDQIHAALITCDQLDWRFYLNKSTVEPYSLSSDFESRIHTVMRLLGLRMGIFDFKLTPEGDPVWFEVNPQGQFLFIEGLSEVKLTNVFTDFLANEVVGQRARAVG